MLIWKIMYLFLMVVLDLLIDIRCGSPLHEQISLSILFGIAGHIDSWNALPMML